MRLYSILVAFVFIWGVVIDGHIEKLKTESMRIFDIPEMQKFKVRPIFFLNTIINIKLS